MLIAKGIKIHLHIVNLPRTKNGSEVILKVFLKTVECKGTTK